MQGREASTRTMTEMLDENGIETLAEALVIVRRIAAGRTTPERLRRGASRIRRAIRSR
jgi:hypothetical protein